MEATQAQETALEDGAPPGAAACAALHRALPAFLEGGLPGAEQLELRRHHRACGACRQHFEQVVSTAARLQHVPRAARIEKERRRRRQGQRRRAVAGMLLSARNPRNARLRLLLLPAFFIVLMVEVSRGPRAAAGAVLTASSGRVVLGDLLLGTVGEPRAVLRGDLCATGDDGAAVLALGETEVELGPATWLWLEDAPSARLRLGGGSVRVRGAATLTSARGVVETSGGLASITLDGVGLGVSASEGSVLVVDSQGERVVSAGPRTSPAGRRAAPGPR